MAIWRTAALAGTPLAVNSSQRACATGEAQMGTPASSRPRRTRRPPLQEPLLQLLLQHSEFSEQASFLAAQVGGGGGVGEGGGGVGDGGGGVGDGPGGVELGKVNHAGL